MSAQRLLVGRNSFSIEDMKRTTQIGKTLVAAVLASTAIIGTAVTAYAHGPAYGGYDYRMAPGMTGRGMMGPGMMGMGPGMMGMGPGMMGMGPGMMGMGPGGCMYGANLAYGPLSQLDLTPEQRNRINAIQEELQKKALNLNAKMQEESLRLRNLVGNGNADPDAIANEYRKLQELQADGLRAGLAAQRNLESVLTAEQRNQLRRYGWY